MGQYESAVRLASDDPQRAIGLLESIVAENPLHAYAQNDLACLLFQQSGSPDAIRHLMQAREVLPLNPDVLSNWKSIDESLQGAGVEQFLQQTVDFTRHPFVSHSIEKLHNVSDDVWQPGNLDAFFASLPPFYFHIGSVDEALLLFAQTSYRPHGQVVVTCNTYDEPGYFPFLQSVRFAGVLRLKWPPLDSLLPKLAEAVCKSDRCLGSTFGLTRDNRGRFEPRGSLRACDVGAPERFLGRATSLRLPSNYIVVSPSGYTFPGEGDNGFLLALSQWPELADFLERRGTTVVLVGTVYDSYFYPALSGMHDVRAEPFETQASLIQDAALAIGVPSWGTTLATLCRTPTCLLTPHGMTAEEFRAHPKQRITLDPWPHVSTCSSLEALSAKVSEVLCAEPSPPPEAFDSPRGGGTRLPSPRQRGPRVLFRLRGNALTRPGGDTTVLRKLLQCIREARVSATLDLFEKESFKGYDLVHLVNFSTPAVVEYHAKKCIAEGIPYVVTTLYEDRPQYFYPMVKYGEWLEDYVSKGQRQSDWPPPWAHLPLKTSPIQDNTFVAHHAEVLLASGASEAAVLRRDYPEAKSVVPICFGCDCDLPSVPADLFERKFGVSDFLLCVGRLEQRKNQLMLLKAFEESPLPIVLVGSSRGDELNYRAACERFRRAGKTLIVQGLSLEELASAYAAAKVHVLPSWFELPGLVTLEAAHFGTPVVATRNGTIEDYLGDLCHYCSPESPESIFSQVMEAFEKPKSEALRDRARLFTWARHARETRETYERFVR